MPSRVLHANGVVWRGFRCPDHRRGRGIRFPPSERRGKGPLRGRNGPLRQGFRPLAFHTRCTKDGETPSSLASDRVVQCVPFAGRSFVSCEGSSGPSFHRPSISACCEGLPFRCLPIDPPGNVAATTRPFWVMPAVARRFPDSICHRLPKERSSRSAKRVGVWRRNQTFSVLRSSSASVIFRAVFIASGLD